MFNMLLSAAPAATEVAKLGFTTENIGEALLLAARTRPKYIGGIRAKYE